MKKILNKKINTGITLIALVITIVVLVILGAVVINLSLGDNGIFNRARTAKEEYNNAQEHEESQIADFEYKIDINSRETVTIPKEEYDMLKNSNSYSQSEKIIGAYFDGKPIYRFCYPFTWESTEFNIKFSDMGLTDYNYIDKVLKSEAHIVSSPNNFTANQFYILADDYYNHYILQDKKSVTFRSGTSWPKLPSEAIFVIEYTKTTD